MANVTVAADVAVDDWAWVPLDLPDDRWASAQAWSDAVGDALAGDAIHERERWRAIAAAVVALPVPAGDVVARVWHTAPGSGTLAVGHVRVGRDLGDEPGVRALAGLESGMLQRLVPIDHPRLDDAVHTVAVGTTGSGVALGALRWSGVRTGTRVTLEVLHPESQRLALAEPAFAALFLTLGVDA